MCFKSQKYTPAKRYFCAVIAVDKMMKTTYDDFNTKECRRFSVRAPFAVFAKVNCVKEEF